MKLLVINKVALLLLSPLCLLTIIAALSHSFDLAQLPTDADTSRNSYFILGGIHIASLLVFLRLKMLSIRHANHQMIWVFFSFTLLSVFGLLAARIDYSIIVLMLGLPCSLALLLSHQHEIAKNDKTSLFVIKGEKAETLLKKEALSFSSLSHKDLAINQTDGLLLISQDSMTSDYFRYAFGFDTPAGKKIVIAERFLETHHGSLENLSLGALTQGAKDSQFYRPIRRFSELLITLALLIVTAPIWVATVILIKLTSPGPAIFSQERVGLDSKSFTIFKFRTMHLDSEKTGQQFATKGDPRIIKYGNFLRKSRIDELPQLWNVLRGDMSLIGPRPEQRALFDSLCQEIPQFELRQLVRPGITGWAQVVQGYADDKDSSRVKLSHDLYYIKHFGPTLDILVITRTLTTILTGFGSR